MSTSTMIKGKSENVSYPNRTRHALRFAQSRDSMGLEGESAYPFCLMHVSA